MAGPDPWPGPKSPSTHGRADPTPVRTPIFFRLRRAINKNISKVNKLNTFFHNFVPAAGEKKTKIRLYF